MNRRELLIGSAAALAASTLPSQASAELFEPLYARVTPDPTSAMYNVPSALYRIIQSKTWFYGRVTTDKAIFNFWRPYDIEKTGLRAWLPYDTPGRMIRINEEQYDKHGMTVSEMPQKVLETHNRILSYHIPESPK
jgi:hypothetical protein